jgi:hypothetical protein
VQPAFSGYTLVLARAFLFLIGLLLVLLPLLLLLLPRLLCPNHQLGPDRALCLLEVCVLAMVLAGVIDVESLQWCGLGWQLRWFGLALLRCWRHGLAYGIASWGYFRRLDVLKLCRWWEGSRLAGWVVGDWWALAVELRLSACVG